MKHHLANGRIVDPFDRMITKSVNIGAIRNFFYLFCLSVTVHGKLNYIPKECYELIGHILTGFSSYNNF